jgi:hypothetical protein
LLQLFKKNKATGPASSDEGLVRNIKAKEETKLQQGAARSM